VTLALTSPTAGTTRALGRALGALVRPGDVLALAGELGAGKTCLVQGVAAALGHDGRVTSPTYLLARTLPTDPPLVHADAWRLDRVADLLDLGDEVLDDDVVTVLEWGDAVEAVLPVDRLEVRLVLAVDELDAGSDDDDLPRTVTLVGHGDWARRLDDAAGALGAAVEVAAC
jgi:tRNA threonylcarbamoyladenosine biosynthesis protein TsaE